MSAPRPRIHPKPTNAPECDDTAANIQRHHFFMQVPGIEALAAKSNVPKKFLVGLASYESGWLDDHNFKLNNLWGLTKAGHDNISFPSIEAGNLYFAHRIGPHIQNVTTIQEFFDPPKKEGYNSKNPDYFSLDPKKGMLYNRIMNIDK